MGEQTKEKKRKSKQKDLAMLTDKIRLSGPETNEPEDYLSSSLAVIFPDDITNQHGDRESSVLYLSPSHGSLELTLADPQGEDSRKLFSHFLWNAGVQLAEFIEERRKSFGVGCRHRTSRLDVWLGRRGEGCHK